MIALATRDVWKIKRRSFFLLASLVPVLKAPGGTGRSYGGKRVGNARIT